MRRMRIKRLINPFIKALMTDVVFLMGTKPPYLHFYLVTELTPVPPWQETDKVNQPNGPPDLLHTKCFCEPPYVCFRCKTSSCAEAAESAVLCGWLEGEDPETGTRKHTVRVSRHPHALRSNEDWPQLGGNKTEAYSIIRNATASEQ